MEICAEPAVHIILYHGELQVSQISGLMLLSPQQQKQTSQWRRCWCCLSDRRHPAPLWLPFYLMSKITVHIIVVSPFENQMSSLHIEGVDICYGLRSCCVAVLVMKNYIILYWWFTLAAAVGWGLWHSQHSLKLLLEAVSSLQQQLQPVDELCTDDVLDRENKRYTL